RTASQLCEVGGREDTGRRSGIEEGYRRKKRAGQGRPGQSIRPILRGGLSREKSTVKPFRLLDRTRGRSSFRTNRNQILFIIFSATDDSRHELIYPCKIRVKPLFYRVCKELAYGN